jgi:hypothetical protein
MESGQAFSTLSRLDPKSQRAVRSFPSRLFLCTSLLLSIAFLDRWPCHNAIGAFHLVCSTSALIAMVVALARREQLRGPFLTFWDESLAFSALSLLMVFVWRETG